jgi:hypothetical protein
LKPCVPTKESNTPQVTISAISKTNTIDCVVFDLILVGEHTWIEKPSGSGTSRLTTRAVLLRDVIPNYFCLNQRKWPSISHDSNFADVILQGSQKNSAPPLSLAGIDAASLQNI